VETKVCKRCGEEKALSEFGQVKSGPKAGHPTLLCSDCRGAAKKLRNKAAYAKNKDYLKAHLSRWREDNPDKVWEHRIAKSLGQYGLTLDSFHAKAEQQNFLCAVCHEEPKPRVRPGFDELSDFFVDHDHETGAVRGLVCIRCNSALGMLRDDVELAMKAALYLEHHHGKRKTPALTRAVA